MTAYKDVAESWLQALAARGVTVTIRNNRLWLHPASAYRALSDDEVLTLRHHRAEIKALVREGKTYAPPLSYHFANLAPAVEKLTPPEPPCRWCYQSPCIGREHPAFDVLHALDPDEKKRRHQEAAADDADARQFLATGRISDRMRVKAEAQQPKMSEEEKQQSEKRRQLGWDAGVLNEASGYRRRE